MTTPTFSGKIYILGAGASAELKFPMTTLDYPSGQHRDYFDVKGPVSSGFFYYLNQFVESVQKHAKHLFDHQPADLLVRYCCEHYAPRVLGRRISPTELLDDEECSRLVNIEQLYRYINDEFSAAPSLLESMQGPGIVMMCLENYISDGLAYISHFCFSENHAYFAKSIQPGDVVVSFNWDVLMEQALHQVLGWNYETGYGLAFAQVQHKTNKDYVRGITPSPNLVLKPHGSINWYSTQSEEAVNLMIPADWNLRGGGGKATAIHRYEQGLGMSKLSAPGSGKFVSPIVQQLMQSALEQAREIIAIGFSFNDFDKAVEEELSRFSYRSDLAVRIVNPNGARLQQVYREIFRPQSVDVVAGTFGEFVAEQSQQ